MTTEELSTFLRDHAKENKDDFTAIFNKLDEISKTLTEIKIQTTKTNGRVNVLESSKTQNNNDKKFIIATAISFIALVVTLIKSFY